MRTRLLVLFVVLVIGFAFPVTAIAGSLTLHPSGFGEKSRANWKAGAGLPDSTGGANQALYMQKMVPTNTFAAGVVLIRRGRGTTSQQSLDSHGTTVQVLREREDARKFATDVYERNPQDLCSELVLHALGCARRVDLGVAVMRERGRCELSKED